MRTSYSLLARRPSSVQKTVRNPACRAFSMRLSAALVYGKCFGRLFHIDCHNIIMFRKRIGRPCPKWRDEEQQAEAASAELAPIPYSLVPSP
jgi:hypothetical protein